MTSSERTTGNPIDSRPEQLGFNASGPGEYRMGHAAVPEHASKHEKVQTHSSDLRPGASSSECSQTCDHRGEHPSLDEREEKEEARKLDKDRKAKLVSTYTVESCPAVRIQRYVPNINYLGEQHIERLKGLPETAPKYIFINPIATVSCDAPLPAFFKQARKRQSEWCRDFQKWNGRFTSRKVDSWVDSDGKLTKTEKFYRRAMQFTGILYVQGARINAKDWSVHENVGIAEYSGEGCLLPSIKAIKSGGGNQAAIRKQLGLDDRTT